MGRKVGRVGRGLKRPSRGLTSNQFVSTPDYSPNEEVELLENIQYTQLPD